MKRASSILLLVLLVSSAVWAKDMAQLTIGNSPETVKNAAVQVLTEAGYSVDSEGPASVVFSKKMTGSGKLFTLIALSPTYCGDITPSLYLTLKLADRSNGTLTTISARVEHTELVVYSIEPPRWIPIDPHFRGECETVQDHPIFMHTRKMLTGLLQDIGSKTSTTTLIHP